MVAAIVAAAAAAADVASAAASPLGFLAGSCTSTVPSGSTGLSELGAATHDTWHLFATEHASGTHTGRALSGHTAAATPLAAFRATAHGSAAHGAAGLPLAHRPPLTC